MTLRGGRCAARRGPERLPGRGASQPWASTCGRCWTCRRSGAVDVRLRQQHPRRGRRRRASPTRSTSPASCPRTSGRSSARARARSAGPRSPAIPTTSRVTDEAVLPDVSRRQGRSHRWISLARERVQFQGLPARICWLGYGERAKMGLVFNELVRTGEVKAPIVIGRDHLDAGSVASPYRETEAMQRRLRRRGRLADPERAAQRRGAAPPGSPCITAAAWAWATRSTPAW